MCGKGLERCTIQFNQCLLNYRLHLAVSPTKNNDRYEWFLEKACEIGTDEISPTIGTHSERKIFKISRAEKILVSAAKQSLKGTVPHINEPVTVKEFISGHGISPGQKEDGVLRLIAYCFDDSSCPRQSVKDVLNTYEGNEVIVMIGPEGDFSREEAELAMLISDGCDMDGHLILQQDRQSCPESAAPISL